jgi:hypothetical protein
MENTFWHISSDPSNFVEYFKKSFELYVESGMIKKIDSEADIFRNEQGRCLVTKDCEAEFYMFITGHYLGKIHCFFMALTSKLVTHLITLYSPPWGSSFWRLRVGEQEKKKVYLAAKADAKNTGFLNPSGELGCAQIFE